MEKESITKLQREILKIIHQNQFIIVSDLAKILHIPKTTVYDSIFIKRNNIQKYVSKVFKQTGKKGRPKVYLTLKEDMNWD